MRIPFRYVYQDIDRHGNVRIYFWRRPGSKVRIHEPLGSEAFTVRYHEILAGPAPTTPPVSDRPKPGTLRWLVASYTSSSAFKRLDRDTQRVRRQILEHCCQEPVEQSKPNGPTVAHMPITRITTKSLRVLRDRKEGLPGAANSRVKVLRALFKWASTAEGTGVSVNPARELERIRTASTGFPEWTIDDVAAFEARHPIGSKARLALAVFLYTGMRRSDGSQFGRQHVQRTPVPGPAGEVYPGWISKPQWKGRNCTPTRIEIPLLQPLAEIMDATEISHKGLAFLLTEYGQPFSIAGLGNWFHDRCVEAGLANRSAHGLRKAGATRAAEAGASAHTLMAIFGWRSLKEAEHYTRAADRKRLATAGMTMLAGIRTGNTDVPTNKVGGNKRGEKQ